ncbi:hypothetical protein IscW_ISCW005285 [Ixodes scapularis]|uniref:Uncharacterized protein n=1 Tax=Ixodes scapularis TaxID=6945 RepID=B7PM96_IXOSC|nr:hypothetical protein IscW_ISCW005285 [Ixodes scapularis]|eukprot:XP_002434894.1 hypothetical protein IscW_ISCW005285 [Ixodes scapularis]
MTEFRLTPQLASTGGHTKEDPRRVDKAGDEPAPPGQHDAAAKALRTPPMTGDNRGRARADVCRCYGAPLLSLRVLGVRFAAVCVR